MKSDGSGNIYTYFADELGSTRTITDSTGHICYDADFTPYGQEVLPNNTNTCPQNYKFTGYERDSETGLDYAFARHYNPRLGRFMSPDPLGGGISDPQTLNRYAYVRNDATDLIDPSGMQQRPPGWEQDNVVTFYLHDSLWENWDVFDFLSAAARGQITGPQVAQYPEFLSDVTSVNAGDYIGTTVVGNFVYNLSSVDEFGIMGPGTAVGWVNVYQSAFGALPVTQGPSSSISSRGPASSRTQTPKEAATQYCRDRGQRSMQLGSVRVTFSFSASGGIANYNTSNDISLTTPAAGASWDIGFNAPKQPAAEVVFGAGRHLGVGFYINKNGSHQGMSLHIGPSIGPPVSLTLPPSYNVCGGVNANR